MLLTNAKNLVALIWELRKSKKNKNENIQPLIEKLEHLFEESPYGFVKHCDTGLDQEQLGSPSWTRELSISKYHFKKAFKEIGVCYLSPEEYERADDKFQGKFYCSVLFPLNNQRTIYFRNDELIEKVGKNWFDRIEPMISLIA